MTLQLAEGPMDSYIRIPNQKGGTDLVHVATFEYMTDAQFDKLLDQLAPFQLEEDGQLSQGRGWRAKARSQRKAAKQQARQIRQQTKADARAAIKYGKAEGIKTGVVKTGGTIAGEVAGKYVDMLGKVVPAIAPALIPGATGLPGGLPGLTTPDQAAAQMAPSPSDQDDRSFFEKYGLWIGAGAAVLIGGYFIFRK